MLSPFPKKGTHCPYLLEVWAELKLKPVDVAGTEAAVEKGKNVSFECIEEHRWRYLKEKEKVKLKQATITIIALPLRKLWRPPSASAGASGFPTRTTEDGRRYARMV